MKMLGLLRVRNEDRWLEACLRSIWFCDHIIVLDDNSIDLTAAICAEFKIEYHRKSYDAGYEEGHDREWLAREAIKHNPEWICSMDGDEVLMEDTWDKIQSTLNNPSVPAIDVLNLHLWNNPWTVRVDGNWSEQHRQRFWRFKQGLLTYAPDHCSIPNEITERPFVRLGAKMLHYGNVSAADRRRRYDRYLACGHDWPTLIQGDPGGPAASGIRLVPLKEALECEKL